MKRSTKKCQEIIKSSNATYRRIKMKLIDNDVQLLFKMKTIDYYIQILRIFFAQDDIAFENSGDIFVNRLTEMDINLC